MYLSDGDQGTCIYLSDGDQDTCIYLSDGDQVHVSIYQMVTRILVSIYQHFYFHTSGRVLRGDTTEAGCSSPCWISVGMALRASGPLSPSADSERYWERYNKQFELYLQEAALSPETHSGAFTYKISLAQT